MCRHYFYNLNLTIHHEIEAFALITSGGFWEGWRGRGGKGA